MSQGIPRIIAETVAVTGQCRVDGVGLLKFDFRTVADAAAAASFFFWAAASAASCFFASAADFASAAFAEASTFLASTAFAASAFFASASALACLAACGGEGLGLAGGRRARRLPQSRVH